MRNSLVKYLYWVSEKTSVLKWNKLLYYNKAVTQHYYDYRLLWYSIKTDSKACTVFLHHSEIILIQVLVSDA